MSEEEREEILNDIIMLWPLWFLTALILGGIIGDLIT